MLDEFCTSLSCIDGRVQEPLLQYIKDTYRCSYVDTVTGPGMDGALAKGDDADRVLEATRISVDKHGSRHIIISGHYDCAGFPVDESVHRRSIKEAVATVKSWNLNADVSGVWVNDRWQIEKVV